MHDHPIAVTVVTGFLGAGKSTLLQRWLSEFPPGSVAVIVNERGDVGVDGELLAAHVAQLREITGGCVCCNSRAELANALLTLGNLDPRPQRILIEVSGAASPSGVLTAIASGSVQQPLRLDGVITVVDVLRIEQALQFDLAVEQLGFADVVVLTHLDLASSQSPAIDVDAVVKQLHRFAPAATVAYSQPNQQTDGLMQWLEQRGEALHATEGSSSHAAMDAASLQFDGPLDEETFGDWMENSLGDIEARILRVKGIVAISGVDSRVIVQGVSQAVDVHLGRSWGQERRSSRMVVIGLGLDTDALREGFLRCASDH